MSGDNKSRSVDSSPEFRVYQSESGGSKLIRKIKESPIMTIGLGGGVGVLAYMMYGLRHRDPNSKLSVYLIHTRLGVQGTIIGALCIGMVAHIYQDQVAPRLSHTDDPRQITEKKGA